MNKKLYFLGFVPSIIYASIFSIVVDVFYYPLSRQNVYEEMETKPIVAFGEEQGVIVYIVESEDGYICYIFTELLMMRRYRAHARFEYVGNDAVFTGVHGRRNFIHLTLSADSIHFYTGEGHFRVGRTRLLPFLSLVLVTNNLFYFLVNSYLKKKR
ncbi:MAG: hypothetical protein FWC90_03425 [Oscillospiraceae bacterium]|nr:hypothetical protein [Oscillospiraceae bacterium]